MHRSLYLLVCILLFQYLSAQQQLAVAGCSHGLPANENTSSLTLLSPGVYFTLDGGWGPYQGYATIQFDGNEYAYDPAMGGVLVYCTPGIYPYVVTPSDASKAISRDTVNVSGNNPIPVKIEIADAHRIDIFVNDQDLNALKGATVSFAGVTLYTDESGLASFDRYPLGTYAYSVSYPGYISIENQPFEVMAQVETITVTLIRHVYDVTFSVKNGNTSLEGASVILGGMEKQTDAQGTAIFRSLAEGTYDYIVTKAGYFEEKGNVIISDGNVFREINLVSITGIDDVSPILAELYPNPVNGWLFVSLPENCPGKCTITLTDILGNLMLESTIDATAGLFRLDVSGLKNGIYLLTAYGKSSKRTFRFIKQ